MRRWTASLVITFWLFSLCTVAVPICENQMHPLPAVSSCLHLITIIVKEAKSYPYLYDWSHHPSGFNQMKLPRTWVDTSAQFTYRCAVTVDTTEGHEEDNDSFTFRDISIVTQRIVGECLLRERGIRPQIGSDLIGFFNMPKTVRVSLRSVRLESAGKVNHAV
ncbi:MAG: hypothetical protein LQ338_006972 [Usnochroma carphineum]|nr:MAG: hypothetical protein LQ338_006972 [Usnochroma carphineum]